jgi:tetratricopeptide (TPR) repeat protein
MRHGRSLGATHPLTQFLSIHPLQPEVEGQLATEARIYARLQQLITARLNQYRRPHHIPEAPERDNRVHLVADFRADDEELQGWSVLYHRYLRPDVSDRLETWEKTVGLDHRTLLRRQDVAVFRLATEMTTHEEMERDRQQIALLKARLKLSYQPPLVGREAVAASVIARLTEAAPRHLLLYGPPGIGKTALAQAIASALIESRAVRDVAWVDVREAASGDLFSLIVSALRLPLLAADASARDALRTYLGWIDCLIVLDHAQALADTPKRLERFVQGIGTGRLLICTERLPHPLPDMATLLLPELDRDSAFSLMEQQADRHSSLAEVSIPFDRLYDTFGGNPGALSDAIKAGTGYLSALSASSRFQHLWQPLSPLARLGWCVLAILGTQPLMVSAFEQIVGDTGSHTTIDELARASVIERQEGTQIVMLPLAWTLMDQALHDPDSQEIRSEAHNAFHRVEDFLLVYPQRRLLNALFATTDRYRMFASARLDLAYALGGAMEHVGLWQAWSRHLEALRSVGDITHQSWVLLRLGIAYRHLAYWEEASYALIEAMSLSGEHGDFERQADARVELGVLLRSRRNMTAARRLFENAYAVYERQNNTVKCRRVLLEIASACVDTGELDVARRFIDQLADDDDFRLCFLRAQVALAEGHPERAMQEALRARSLLAEDSPDFPRLIALFGQIHFALGEWEQSVDTLTWALRAMEEQQDLVGSQHVRLNLGMMYASQGRLLTAATYLRSLPPVDWE